MQPDIQPVTAHGRSLLRAVMDLRTVVDVEDVHNPAALLDPVDDAVSPAPGAVTSRQWPEQRLPDPLRIDRKRSIAELQDRGGNSFRKPLGNRSPCSRLKTDFVPLRVFGRHAPVTRRRARSWRTVAMSAPGSPRPRAARLSEMRATASVSPRISRVISKPSRSSTDSKTASGSPLRVKVMRSCCWRTRVAQLRYSANTNHWSRYWADRNDRWHRYDDIDPGPVDKALNEIEADPTCIFWG